MTKQTVHSTPHHSAQKKIHIIQNFMISKYITPPPPQKKEEKKKKKEDY
jgi:hypothetical protein